MEVARDVSPPNSSKRDSAPTLGVREIRAKHNFETTCAKYRAESEAGLRYVARNQTGPLAADAIVTGDANLGVRRRRGNRWLGAAWGAERESCGLLWPRASGR